MAPPSSAVGALGEGLAGQYRVNTGRYCLERVYEVVGLHTVTPAPYYGYNLQEILADRIMISSNVSLHPGPFSGKFCVE